jgi:hypothetical protein
MRELFGTFIIVLATSLVTTAEAADPLGWAYGFPPAGALRQPHLRLSVRHGDNLKGVGPVPGLAGRSPSYLMRQMVDMQQGARDGVWGDLIKLVLGNLTEADLQAVSAYAA